MLNAIANKESQDEAPLVLQGLPELFSLYELNPVAPKAQKKVPIPSDLDLDAWINEPLPDLVADSDSDDASTQSIEAEPVSVSKKKKRSKKYQDDDDEEEKERVSTANSTFVASINAENDCFHLAPCGTSRSFAE